MLRHFTLLLLAACFACLAAFAYADSPPVIAPPAIDPQSTELQSTDREALLQRVDQLEADLQAVQQQLGQSVASASDRPSPVIPDEAAILADCTTNDCSTNNYPPNDYRAVTPTVASTTNLAMHCEPACNSRYFVEYDQGWLLRPACPADSPFALKVNLQNQFRYTGFANSADSFTDLAGVTTLINSRNDFDINRGRLLFSGYAFTPDTRFYTNIDYNSVSERQVQLLTAYIEEEFDSAFIFRYGLSKVPGSWEWQESSRVTLGAERTMATTFFRPSMTTGIWARGNLSETLHYEGMIGDGFNTFTLNAAQLDSNFAYSTMLWWEPLGDYGQGFSDFEQHESPVIRLGQALTYTRNESEVTGEPGPEQTVIRLSDGTRLVDPGALAPGATVNQFDITLYAAHLGIKHRGISFSLEYYLRWLTEIQATLPVPIDDIFDHGFYAQAGSYLIPKKLELYGLGSYVTGEFGDGSEIGGGLNWYVQSSRNWRMTFDMVHLSTPPTVQSRTGLVVGGSGSLFRVQSWMYF